MKSRRIKYFIHPPGVASTAR